MANRGVAGSDTFGQLLLRETPSGPVLVHQPGDLLELGEAALSELALDLRACG